MSTTEERLDYLESLLIQDKTKDPIIFDFTSTRDATNKQIKLSWTEQHYHTDDVILLEITDAQGISHGGGYREGKMGLNYVERICNYKNWSTGAAVLLLTLNGVELHNKIVAIP